MDATGLVGAASGAVVASLAVAEASRRYWTRRETRQQAAFKAAVQLIVDEALSPIIARQLTVIERQDDAERRQGKHLDRQDRAIEQLRQDVRKLHGEG